MSVCTLLKKEALKYLLNPTLIHWKAKEESFKGKWSESKMKTIYNTNYLLICRHCIQFLSFFSLIPFEWANSENPGWWSTFGKLKPKTKLLLWYMWCGLLWLRTLLLVLKLAYLSFTQKISLGIGVVFLLWIATFLSASFLTVHPIMKMREFCDSFNAFKSFELRHQIRPLAGVTNVVVTILFINTLSIPLVLPMLCLIAPCGPQFIGSEWLLDETGNCTATGLDRLIMYLIEFLCAIPIGGICAFFSVYAIYLTKSLNRFLMHAKRSNPFEIMMNNVRSITLMIHRASLYRQIQLLNHLYHECFQMQLLPNMLFSSSVIIIICLFAIVELKDELPVLVYALFPFIMLITLVFLLIMLDMTSKVIPLSKSIRSHWTSKYAGASPWFAAMVKSCPVLKIHAGPFSKIGRDKMATVIRFCLQRSIFFMIWSRNIRNIRSGFQ